MHSLVVLVSSYYRRTSVPGSDQKRIELEGAWVSGIVEIFTRMPHPLVWLSKTLIRFVLCSVRLFIVLVAFNIALLWTWIRLV